MRLQIKYIEQTEKDRAFAIIDKKELSRIGINTEVLLDKNQRKKNVEHFLGQLCWFANMTFFGGTNGAITCLISAEDENNIRFTFIDEPYEDEYDSDDCYYSDVEDYESDLDYFDDEYNEYDRISKTLKNIEGPVGIVEVDSFKNCLKTIGFLRSYSNKAFEIYNIKNRYYINVKECQFPKEKLEEFCAGVVDYYSEYYLDMIKAYAKEHNGSIFHY